MTSGRLLCRRKPEHLYLNEESGGRDSKRRGGNGSRENDGGEPVSVQGLKQGNRKIPERSHLGLSGEIRKKAAGGRGVLISSIRSIF